MEQVPRDTACASPDADRQQHDIHHPEAGNRERADQLVCAAFFLGQRIVCQNLDIKSQRLDFALELNFVQFREMRYGHLFGRKIDPRR